MGWIFVTTPGPNARCVTRSPKAGAALPAGFAAGGAGRMGGLRRGSGAETV